MATAADEIDEWEVTHESAVDRELAAMNFEQKLGTPVANDDKVPRNVAANVTGVGRSILSSVAEAPVRTRTRDAVYAIGKEIFSA